MGGLDELLRLEASSTLWETTIGDVHPWALIRTSVLEELMKRERGFSEARPPDRRGPALIFRVYRHLRTLSYLLTHWLNPSTSPPEVLFFTPQTVRIPKEGGQVSRNRLYDDYYRYFAEPLIFESGHPGKGMAPLIHGGSIYLDDTVQLISRLWARIRGLDPLHEQQALRFIEDVLEIFHLEDRRAWVQEITLMNLRWALNPEVLERIIDTRVTSGLAFVHSASYMKRYGLLTAWLHERGLKVVEVQHGYISALHPAYNHPASSLDDPDHPCRRYLPDHLLVFGSHWASQIRVPAKLHVVGYPHLDRLSLVTQRRVTTRTEDILIISQGYVTTQMVEVAEALARTFPDRTIHFKLHPGEVDYRDRYGRLDEYRNMVVHKGGDIYQLIAGCGIIVGYFSTALFEALRFANKRLFYLDNDLVPQVLGHGFTTPEQLVEALKEDQLGRPEARAGEFWYPHWNKAFNEFMARVRPR